MQVTKTDVAIVGAGFGGLGVGIALQNRKLENFVIFEGEPDVPTSKIPKRKISYLMLLIL